MQNLADLCAALGWKCLQRGKRSLGLLGIKDLPNIPSARPELNPIDVYRLHLTSILSDITGVDQAIIYPALQWTLTLDKGDLVLPVPALRIKGQKPPALAAEWAAKFPESPLVEKPTVFGAFLQFFFKPLPLSTLVIPTVLKKGAEYGLNPTNGMRDATDPTKGKKRLVKVAVAGKTKTG